MTPQEIVTRYDALASQRKTVEQTWDLIEKFIGPMRGGKFFQDQTSEHEVDWRRGRDVYDNTAMVAVDILASSIHSSLTSPALQWFDMRFRDEKLNKDTEAKRWLEQCSEILFQSLGDSNFNTEINETYLDLVTYGSSILTEEEADTGDGDIAFSSVPIRECHFEADHRGNLYRLFRCLEWTPTQIMEKFGDKTPEDIKEKAKNPGSVDTREKVIFCVWKRTGAKGERDTVLAPNMRPFGSHYILHRSAAPLSEEGGYYEMPAFFVRWKKASGSMWGFGPGTLALSDTMTLNQLIELVLKATEKVVDPATLATERGILSDLDLGAGGLTVVRDVAGVKAYESGARFDVSALQVQDLRHKINRTFLVDQLELKESPAMTATEVNVRWEMMQRLLGPTLGRLQSDLLDPLVERTFFILMRSRKLPPPPQSVRESGSAMDIEYVGPLARSQRIDRVASMERWVAQVGQLGQVMPDILDLPNPDQVGRVSARLLGVPAEVIFSEAEVAARRRQRQAQQQEQMMLANANAAATAMQGVAGAAKDLSMSGQGGMPVQ
jgi:hypothetical protein